MNSLFALSLGLLVFLIVYELLTVNQSLEVHLKYFQIISAGKGERVRKKLIMGFIGGGVVIALLGGLAIGKERDVLILIGVLAGLAKIYERRRLKKIEDRYFYQTPDFLDLFSMGLSAGFSAYDAFRLAVDYSADNELKVVMKKIFIQWRNGNTLKMSFESLVSLFKDHRLKAVWMLVGQAALRGTPIDPLLEEQSKNLRRLIEYSLDKKAQTIGIRLLFPILIFIFPSIFVVIFGPFLVYWLNQGLLYF